VIYCLSEAVRNDTLTDANQRVSQKCRAQLQVELLALDDVVELDPVFAKACKPDMADHCASLEGADQETVSPSPYSVLTKEMPCY